MRDILAHEQYIGTMAPASVLDWSEPRQQQQQQWRGYGSKNCGTTARPQPVKTQSTIELSDKEADTAYKKICKFLRRLKSKKCEVIVYRTRARARYDNFARCIRIALVRWGYL